MSELMSLPDAITHDQPTLPHLSTLEKEAEGDSNGQFIPTSKLKPGGLAKAQG